MVMSLHTTDRAGGGSGREETADDPAGIEQGSRTDAQPYDLASRLSRERCFDVLVGTLGAQHVIVIFVHQGRIP